MSVYQDFANSIDNRYRDHEIKVAADALSIPEDAVHRRTKWIIEWLEHYHDEIMMARKAGDVTSADIRRMAAAMFKYDWPKDDWDRLGPGYHQDRYIGMVKAALAASTLLRGAHNVADRI